MFAVSPFCFRVSTLVFVPLAHFRTPEYEFRTISGCAVKMYQIWRFVLMNLNICKKAIKKAALRRLWWR